MSLATPLNKYTCEKCKGVILTLDVDEGVTPFMLPCMATATCEGNMTSSFYNTTDLEQRIGQPAFEWYKPTSEEYARLGQAMKDHVDQGGLDLRTADTKQVFRMKR